MRAGAVERVRSAELDHGGIGQLMQLAGERPPPRVAEPVPDGGRGVDVDDEERLLERGCAGDHLPVLVEDE